MATIEDQRVAGVQDEPARRGARAGPVAPDDAVHLRGDRRPCHAQAAAGALQPRPRGGAAGALQPDRLSRSDMSDEDFREMDRDVDREFSRRRRPTRRCSRRCCARSATSRAPSTTRSATSGSRGVRRAFDEEAGIAVQPRLLPLDGARLLPGDRGGRSAQRGLQRDEDAEVRVVIEKPFGYDLAVGARISTARCSRCFDERQVFRIDHYLGKETVQNLLAFRFANAMFEPVWNRNYIDSVQITAAEDIGIGTRAGYYDIVRRAARPGPEPHAAAADAALHGAAGRRSRPTSCATRR